VAQSVNVLIVGGGGREHALAWRLRQENPNARILSAPGNPGIAELAECVSVGATDIDGLLALARQEGVDWTLVGPEAPLAAGLVDAFGAARMPIFGPTRGAAMLETSKAFSKSLMQDASVPTARATVCNDLRGAERAIDMLGAPVVIKASGLAAGKGVIVCQTAEDARAAAQSMLEQHAFGDAGATILVEEFMQGEELSLFVLTDGVRAVPLPAARDHKRLLDGDRGPNTGGMGAYCPVSLPDQPESLVDEVLDRIVLPTLDRMRERGAPFTGLLYVGLMLTADGPKVVEFNCRFGDPETQAVLPAIDPAQRLSDAMAAIAHGERLSGAIRFDVTRSAVTTVLASAGYPERPRTGDSIIIPPIPPDVLVFHAGTKRDVSGVLATAGGRVLAVTGVGDTFEDAQRRSLDFAEAVTFNAKQFRTDIGWRELARRAGTP
jgi:phosphoribosylamine--glycine ligase